MALPDGATELEAAVANADGWMKAPAMADLAAALQGTDRERATTLATEAVDILEATSVEPDVAPKRDEALALSLTILALNRLDTREHDAAMALATRARDVAERAGASAGRSLVRAESVLATIRVVQGSIDEARRSLVHRLDHLPAGGNDHVELRASILNDLGRVHFHAGDAGPARACFLEALELVRADGKSRLAGTCLTNLANVMSHLGDIEGALDAYAESLARHRAAGLRRGTALALHNLGVMHHRVGEHAIAVQYTRDAEAELAAGDPDAISATNLLQRADSLLALGAVGEALECVERALALEEGSRNEMGVARALTMRASVLGAMGRDAHAMADAQRALETLEARGTPALRITCRQVITQLHLQRGHVELALLEAEPLLEETRALADPLIEIDVTRLLVHCLRRSGRHEAALVLGERLQALEAERHRAAQSQRIESLKLRHQIEQGRHREEALRIARDEMESLVADRTRELVAANEELRGAIAERDRSEEDRRRLEGRLHHAGKLEAAGRVAAEVAHDFNNILTVIGGSAEALADSLPDGKPATRLARDIRDAVERGVALTRQLQACSGDAHACPTLVDVNELVRNADGLLRRLAGEPVRLQLRLAPSAAIVLADAARLDQVLLNLVANARDAMPGGGTITIETRVADVAAELAAFHPGARPGPHVVLSVSDTGVGMDAATQARSFEPYFTTKTAGKGSGLGLAVVFGVVQQCCGFIVVESELGRGSTFLVHLPLAAAT